MQETLETQVQTLVWEDPLEEGMANHSSVLGWIIAWSEEPGGLQSTWLQRVRHDSTNIYTDIISSEKNKTHKFNSFLVKRH